VIKVLKIIYFDLNIIKKMSNDICSILFFPNDIICFLYYFPTTFSIIMFPNNLRSFLKYVPTTSSDFNIFQQHNVFFLNYVPTTFLDLSVSEPKGRRSVRRLLIKMKVSGGSAPASPFLSALGPPQGCAS
jgi:hypothetical protein